jgi:hypothetical protein
MAKTAQLNTDVGADCGSTNVCQDCGGDLETHDGSSPRDVSKLDGFVEDYRCGACGGLGRYKESLTGKSYVGVCAGGECL